MSTPQMPQPQGQLPPAKKISPIVWILVGIVGFMFLVAIVLGVGGYFFARKVKEMAGSPVGVARMLTAMNPDVEVISSDESTGKITIKEKKTGKVITVNLDDIKNGKIVFQEDGKEAVSIQASGDGKEGSVDIKTAEGTAHLGSGASKAPAWVPAYPGSSPQGNYSASTDKEDTGSYTFKTPDSVDKVSKHYQETLKSAGFTVEHISMGEGGVVSGKTEDEKRTVVVTLSKDGSETTAAVVFNEKK